MRRMIACSLMLCAAFLVCAQDADPCREACHAEAMIILERCVQSGMPKADCERRAAEFESRCVAERCETIVPDPVTCEDRCELAAREEMRVCLAAGGSEAACEERFNAAFKACIEANCQVEPPPPDDCAARCQLQAEELFAQCIAMGVSERDCAAKRDRFLQACLTQNCNVQPPPPPPTCEARCELMAREEMQACLAAGGSEAACKEKFAVTFKACLEANCQVEPPPPPTCELVCEQYANGVLRECMAAGGTERECWAKRQAALEECLATKCQIVPPEPTCEQQCYTAAKQAYEACRANNGGEEECRAAYEETLRTCLADQCNVEPPPPPEPTCEQQCYIAAKQAYTECVANGGSEEECRAKIEESVRACLTENCGVEPPPPPPEPTCERECYVAAKQAYAECIANNGSEEECRAKYQEVVNACLAENCGVQPPEPPEPPLPCDEDCSARAAQFYDACLANGGSPETCRAQADALLALCLVRCGNGPSCENRCAVAAQIVLTGCAVGGLPAEECRRLANKVLEDCVQGCVRPGGCGQECERLAARARAECTQRGGSAEECEAAAKEVLVACGQYCEGTPMPGCDVQCEDMAAQMAARCAEAGLPAEYCQTVQQRFLDACVANHGANCGQEDLGALTMFKPFRRGDVNDDGTIDIADPITILQQLFGGRPAGRCEDVVDANDDGEINIADPVCVLGHLFGRNGTALAEPFLNAGQDPTSDALICEP